MGTFFIDRPVFAAVIAILITLLGLLAIPFIPLTQYPDIGPPTVEVSASYPGATAEVVANSVAAPLEEELNGLEGVMYMSSSSSSTSKSSGNGTGTIAMLHMVCLTEGMLLTIPALVHRN